MQTRNKAQASYTGGNGGGGAPANGAGTGSSKGAKPLSGGGATAVGSSASA